MDKTDREKYVLVYRILAEILERPRPADPQEDHVSYKLGDLARRVFGGTHFDPPDDVLESVAHVIRTGNNEERLKAAQRLHDHAHHLEHLDPSS